ncbi:Crp/Fnr family transcriptional regulator [Sphingomonas sp.]|jgi:CRP-like cAMP-binding protein|uniref:Crp/Fnr family transcriptional regulator n=1 Tax=Sphingomonas sp. TaxID=28214 RepID=UPI002D808854|nr:Crp/Fnr family transcriptional regulator [Sphingomonas sp.]HEU0044960.1 Crp/Fnr family transcriptional regulator [Sphingomonas sp.]
MTGISQASTANLLLRALSCEDYSLLEPALERNTLPVRTVLFEPGMPMERVHFPEGGVASIVTEDQSSDTVELGLFGSDGMSGGAMLLGAGQSPHRCFIQIGDGTSLHLPTGALITACERSPTLRRLLLQFVHTLEIQTATTASANAHYELPQRLARWLLMCHDRVDGDRLELTHEFMSQMLAVRRSGVTVTLHTLESTGAIRSTRGLVMILNRARLREFAGDSYGTPEREYSRLIAPFGRG